MAKTKPSRQECWKAFLQELDGDGNAGKVARKWCATRAELEWVFSMASAPWLYREALNTAGDAKQGRGRRMVKALAKAKAGLAEVLDLRRAYPTPPPPELYQALCRLAEMEQCAGYAFDRRRFGVANDVSSILILRARIGVTLGAKPPMADTMAVVRCAMKAVGAPDDPDLIRRAVSHAEERNPDFVKLAAAGEAGNESVQKEP